MGHWDAEGLELRQIHHRRTLIKADKGKRFTQRKQRKGGEHREGMGYRRDTEKEREMLRCAQDDGAQI